VFENRVLRRIYESRRDEVAGAEEKCIMRNFITCTLHTQVDQIKKNQFSGTCRMHGRDVKCIQNFGRKTRREETNLKTKAYVGR